MSRSCSFGSMHTLRRQQGAETVEFMITLLLFFAVFLMIIEFAIVTYDRGTINNAVREGSRQASLYWVDPALYDPFAPDDNQRVKHAMVDSVFTWMHDNLLIDPGGSGVTVALNVNGGDLAFGTQAVNADSQVTVNASYTHQFIALHGLLSASAFTLNSTSGAGVE